MENFIKLCVVYSQYKHLIVDYSHLKGNRLLDHEFNNVNPSLEATNTVDMIEMENLIKRFAAMDLYEEFKQESINESRCQGTLKEFNNLNPSLEATNPADMIDMESLINRFAALDLYKKFEQESINESRYQGTSKELNNLNPSLEATNTADMIEMENLIKRFAALDLYEKFGQEDINGSSRQETAIGEGDNTQRACNQLDEPHLLLRSSFSCVAKKEQKERNAKSQSCDGAELDREEIAKKEAIVVQDSKKNNILNTRPESCDGAELDREEIAKKKAIVVQDSKKNKILNIRPESCDGAELDREEIAKKEKEAIVVQDSMEKRILNMRSEVIQADEGISGPMLRPTETSLQTQPPIQRQVHPQQAYVTQGSKGDKAPYPFRGLKNEANLCFANSLLQCLRFTCIKGILEKHLKCGTPCFLCILRDFFSNKWNSCEKVCRKMEGIWGKYKYNTQQDCHEMYEILLQVLKECSHCSNYIKYHFIGLQKETVTCYRCGNSEPRPEEFHTLSLSLTNDSTLSEAVHNSFVSQEKECKDCKETVNVKKNLVSIPVNVVFRLERASRSGQKVITKLKVDEVINLQPYMDANEKALLKDEAELYSAIIHLGPRIDGGHFIAIIKHNEQWYQVDDFKINHITKQEAHGYMEDSYLLFYRT